MIPAKALHVPSPEILEPRVAPAVVLLSTTSATIPGDKGAYNTGADGSVLLVAGDILGLDLDADGKLGPGETLVKVTGSNALVFLTDDDANPGWSKAGISGVSLGNKSVAQVFADVNGSIVTALDASGNFTVSSENPENVVIQYASIKSLLVQGNVSGIIQSGADIDKLYVGRSGGAEAAAQAILSGSNSASTFQTASFGTVANTLEFTQPAGKPGGSPYYIAIASWVRAILAGDGADATATTQATPGGSVYDVDVYLRGLDLDEPMIFNGGDGGDGSADSPGAKGGSVYEVEIRADGRVGPISMRGGDGGSGAGGGDGGALKEIEIFGVHTGDLTLVSGSGGMGGAGKGGNGGAVSKVEISMRAGGSIGETVISAGSGADGTLGGGKGGTIKTVGFHASTALGDLTVTGGTGGDGKKGGAGGGLIGNSFNVGEGSAIVALIAGAGGDGDKKGGAGGSILVNEVIAASQAASIHRIVAGNGGGAPVPGAGGSIADLIAQRVADAVQPLDIGILETGREFGFGDDAMGGLAAGLGGGGNASLNGSVSGINAGRIAAIVAGTPGPVLTEANAVVSIKRLTIEGLGGDTVGEVGFDFTNNGGAADFDLGTDAARDGLALVQIQSASIRNHAKEVVTPLKLIVTS